MRRHLVRTILGITLLIALLIGAAACGADGSKESGAKQSEASEICFTTFSTNATLFLKSGDSASDFERTADGRVILKSGMLYKVKENTVELMSAAYEEVKDLTIIEYVDPDEITLSCVVLPQDAAAKTIRYYCDDTNVTIDSAGKVVFAEPSERPVQIVARTQDGLFARIVLVWNKPQQAIPMS